MRDAEVSRAGAGGERLRDRAGSVQPRGRMREGFTADSEKVQGRWVRIFPKAHRGTMRGTREVLLSCKSNSVTPRW